MKHWSVTAQGQASVQVPARNWMVALGRGLDELGQADRLERLACEVLPNGTVIARDVGTGTGYVVHAVDAPDPPSDVDATIEAEESEAEALFVLPDESDPDDVDQQIEGASSAVLACEIALGAALAEVPAESGAVILAERGHLRFTAARGPHSEALVGTRLPPGTGVAGFAMTHQRTIVVDDAQDDPRHCGDVDRLTGYVTRQIAVVPVGRGAEAIGVIEVMNLTRGHRFDAGQLAAIERVARALGARLEA